MQVFPVVFFLDHFLQVLTFSRSNLHIIQDQLSAVCEFLNTTTEVPRPGLQDLSPSLSLSVNQSQHVSSIQKPHCGLYRDWWWAKKQRLVLWKALRGAMETLHTQNSERPDIESRVSEQWTASCTSDAEQGFRQCTMWGRWVAVRNK